MKCLIAMLSVLSVLTVSAVALGGEAAVPSAGSKLFDKISQTDVNAWVKLDEAGLAEGRSLGCGLTYLPTAGKFLQTGVNNKTAEMLFDPATGKWEEAKPGLPPEKLLNESASCFLAWDHATNRGYGYIGSDVWSKNLLCFDYAQKTWTNPNPKNPPPMLRESFIRWSSVCWLPDSGEMMLANGSAPYGGSGTWLYNPKSNEWRQLKFGSPLINGQRDALQKLFTQTQDLVAACRNRHYRSETPDAAKVDLAKSASDLMSAIKSASSAVAAAKSDDKYEAQQLTRCKAALETAAKLLDEQSKKLGSSLNASLLTAMEDGLLETVRGARDELAVEPPPRCNSPLVWNPEAKRVVCFGGDGHNRTYADTWTFDPASSRWNQMHPAIGPEPKAGHALVWLPKAKTVLLVGHAYAPNQGRGKDGVYETLPFEMWTYDLKADRWSLLKHVEKDTDAPSAEMRATDCSTFAAGADDLVVGMGRTGFYGGEVKLSTWACRVDASKIDAEGTQKYGVKPGTLYFFGGPAGYDHDPVDDVPAAEARLKNLPANTWTALLPKGAFVPNAYGSWGTCVMDTDSDQILWWRGGHAGYCGNDVGHYSLKANTWSISYRPSHPLNQESSCGGLIGTDFEGHPWVWMHSYHRYGYDQTAKRMVLSVSNTFTYDPARQAWDKIYYPPKVGNFVATPHGMMAGSRGDAPQFFQFDCSKGWQGLPTQGAWPAFCGYSGSYSYDSKRDRVLCASGKGYTEVKEGSVWSYDVKTGAAVDLKAANAEKVKFETETARESVYLPDADMILFMAGGKDSHYVYDVAKNAWKSVRLKPNNVAASNLIGSGLVYDPKRKIAFIVGADANGWNVFAMRFDPATAEFVELK